MSKRKIKNKILVPDVRQTIDSMIDGCAIVNDSGTILLANDALAGIYGFVSANDVLLKKVSRVLMAADDFEYVMRELKNNSVNRFEFRVKKRNGNYFMCQFKISLVEGEYPAGACYLIVAEDVTHFREVYSEVDRLSAKYEAILALVPDIIMEMNENLIYTWANDAAYVFFGPEVVGKNSLEFFEGEVSPRTVMRPILDGSSGVLYLENWQRRRDGAKRLLAWWHRIVRDSSGKVRSFICTARDVTEAKEAEIAKINSEERMRVLAHELREWIWEFNTEGLYTYSGSAVEKMLGYKPEEVVGKKYFYDLFHSDDREELKSRVFKNVWDGAKMREFMSRSLHKNGEVRWLSTSGIPVVGKGGGLSGYWGITIDVTERVKSEQIRDSLVRNFSHSIKTPVAMIDMANEMLRIAIESGNWGMVKKSFGMMRFNLKTLNNDLDNILESIAIQGRGPTISKVSLSGIINEITSKFEDQVALKNLGVTIDIASDADAAIADIGDLKTLFRNVMDNAVKFTSDGEIYISAKRKGNVVEVKVRDTGCGISAADVGMVKQKFFRVNPAVPGIGLGLSICSEIACRMGGSFEIFSEGKGKGVTVVIEIPAESGGAHVETK